MLQFTTSLQGSKVQLAPPTEISAGKHDGRANSEIGYCFRCERVETEDRIVKEVGRGQPMISNTSDMPHS